MKDKRLEPEIPFWIQELERMLKEIKEEKKREKR